MQLVKVDLTCYSKYGEEGTFERFFENDRDPISFINDLCAKHNQVVGTIEKVYVPRQKTIDLLNRTDVRFIKQIERINFVQEENNAE